MNPRRRDNLEELLSAYLDDELTEGRRAEVDAWLATCAEARRTLAELRRASELLADLPRGQAPDDVAEFIAARLEREALLGEPGPAGGEPVAPRSRRRIGPWLASAAAIALAVSAGLLTFSRLRHERPAMHESPIGPVAAARSRGGEPEGKAAGVSAAPAPPTASEESKGAPLAGVAAGRPSGTNLDELGYLARRDADGDGVTAMGTPGEPTDHRGGAITRERHADEAGKRVERVPARPVAGVPASSVEQPRGDALQGEPAEARGRALDVRAPVREREGANAPVRTVELAFADDATRQAAADRIARVLEAAEVEASGEYAGRSYGQSKKAAQGALRADAVRDEARSTKWAVTAGRMAVPAADGALVFTFAGSPEAVDTVVEQLHSEFRGREELGVRGVRRVGGIGGGVLDFEYAGGGHGAFGDKEALASGRQPLRRRAGQGPEDATVRKAVEGESARSGAAESVAVAGESRQSGGGEFEAKRELGVGVHAGDAVEAGSVTARDVEARHDRSEARARPPAAMKQVEARQGVDYALTAVPSTAPAHRAARDEVALYTAARERPSSAAARAGVGAPQTQPATPSPRNRLVVRLLLAPSPAEAAAASRPASTAKPVAD